MRKLQMFFRSSAAFRARIALNYKGLAYEPMMIIISLPKDEQKGAGARSPSG